MPMASRWLYYRLYSVSRFDELELIGFFAVLTAQDLRFRIDPAVTVPVTYELQDNEDRTE